MPQSNNTDNERFGENEDKPFLELPFDEVDFSGGHWGWGHGDGKYNIRYVDENMNSINYSLPSCLCEMLRLRYKRGEENAKLAMRRALDI